MPVRPEPARVGEVVVVGNTRTREDVIRRDIPLVPGQILDDRGLEATRRNLARFRPEISVIEEAGTSFRTILVDVHETR